MHNFDHLGGPLHISYIKGFFSNLTNFQILGQNFIIFFVGFLENFKHLKVLVKLTDLQYQTAVSKTTKSKWKMNRNQKRINVICRSFQQGQRSLKMRHKTTYLLSIRSKYIRRIYNKFVQFSKTKVYWRGHVNSLGIINFQYLQIRALTSHLSQIQTFSQTNQFQML